MGGIGASRGRQGERGRWSGVGEFGEVAVDVNRGLLTVSRLLEGLLE